MEIINVIWLQQMNTTDIKIEIYIELIWPTCAVYFNSRYFA